MTDMEGKYTTTNETFKELFLCVKLTQKDNARHRQTIEYILSLLVGKSTVEDNAINFKLNSQARSIRSKVLSNLMINFFKSLKPWHWEASWNIT